MKSSALAWIDDLRKTQTFKVEPIPFSKLSQWQFDEASGNLVHQTGKFFRVLGLQQTIQHQGRELFWEQPIIEQPEVGILGFATRLKENQRQFLVQAKLEPGTVNGWQISPTMQATKSNYSQVHQGQKPPYIELFTEVQENQIVYDSLQSEHGSRFLAKKNRNLIIEIDHEIELRPEFFWVGLDELQALSRIPNLLNMPCRSVLAAANYQEQIPADRFSHFGHKIIHSLKTLESEEASLQGLKKWITSARQRAEIKTQSVGLKDLSMWTRTEDRIAPKPRTAAAEIPAFSIGAVRVEAQVREVARWSQPLAWCDRGFWISGLITQVRGGVLHLLVQNLFEIGLPEKSELAPTLSYRQPEMGLRDWQGLDYQNYFAKALGSQIRYQSLQSSEGGRFYHEQNQLMILELEADHQIETTDRHHWVTMAQLKDLLQEPGWIGIELRELLACMSLTEAP